MQLQHTVLQDAICKMSVCLSVCPSHAGIASSGHHRVASSFYCLVLDNRVTRDAEMKYSCYLWLLSGRVYNYRTYPATRLWWI